MFMSLVPQFLRLGVNPTNTFFPRLPEITNTSAYFRDFSDSIRI